MKNTFQTTIQIEGSGHSKELAINTALGKIQKKIMNEYKGLILRIEPVDVKILEAKEINYTERFLMLFFPRQRSKYKVSLEVEVNVFMLEVDGIHFEKSTKPDNIRTMLLGHQSK